MLLQGIQPGPVDLAQWSPFPRLFHSSPLHVLIKLWTIKFHEIAAEFEGIVFIGYNSELQKIIWQQWGDGEYDEGALSNLDKIDHYADNNIKTEHKVDLKYLSLSKKYEF